MIGGSRRKSGELVNDLDMNLINEEFEWYRDPGTLISQMGKVGSDQ